MDAIELLTDQHRKVDAAFDEFASLAPANAERKKEIARSVITDLAVHAGIEEIAFYPAVKDALPEMADEIDHDLEEHQQAKELLAKLQGMDPSDDEFDATFDSLIEDVRHHVADEEQVLFPRVEQAMTTQERGELGQAMEDLEIVVPTNPHPHEPQTPLPKVAVGPAAAAIDRLRDAIRERTGS